LALRGEVIYKLSTTSEAEHFLSFFDFLEFSVLVWKCIILSSYFHWSSCSAGEYHYKSNGWKCAFNYPHTVKNATFIGDIIEYTYSLDDQCRMEFGEGYRFCRSFQVLKIFVVKKNPDPDH
jgi:hypothetical protein